MDISSLALEPMWLNKKAGIYCIYNIITGEGYVGSTKGFHTRMVTHLSRLRADNKYSVSLQNAFNEYGEHVLSFLVLEYLETEEELDSRERFWIHCLKPEYNYQGKSKRYTFSKERNLKISNTLSIVAKRGPDSPLYKKSRSKEIIDRIFATRKTLDKNDIYEKRQKKIVMLDNNLCFLKEFASVSDAERDTGIARDSIVNVCKMKSDKRKRITVWFKFKNDWENELNNL